MSNHHSDNKSKVIVVTGMHRSGTSLTTNLIQNMGVHVGNEFLRPDESNKYGFWEDLDFWNFQDGILIKRGLNYLVTTDDPIVPDMDEIHYAKELINKKSINPVWGWKDPRTALFLDFWNDLIPSSKFVFVYRHPVEAFLSLMKAADRPVVQNPHAGLIAWKIYNERILRFFQLHREKSVLCNIHNVVNNHHKFFDMISYKFGLERTPEFKKIYQSETLHTLDIPDWFIKFLEERYPEILDLYNLLEKDADLPLANAESIKDRKSFDNSTPFVDYALESIMGIPKRLWEWHHSLDRMLLHQEEELNRAKEELYRTKEELNRIENTRARLIVKKLEKMPGILIRPLLVVFDILTAIYLFIFKRKNR